MTLQNHLNESFAMKPPKFWEDGKFKLKEKWRKVVQQNSSYLSE